MQRVRDVIKLITMSGLELDGVISLASERLVTQIFDLNNARRYSHFMEGNDVFIALSTGSGN